MFINRDAPLLHIIRFRNGPLMYMTTATHAEESEALLNAFLRNGSFPNAAFQTAYEAKKSELGLLNPNPGELLIHQFISTTGASGYSTGHWLLRDLIGNSDGLTAVSNVGDWLDVEGFIDITPPDQDAVKYLRVSDIGKYYASQGYFEKECYPVYILACENNQIIASNSQENHRDQQPVRGGYDQVVRPTTHPDGSVTFHLLSYNDVSITLTDIQEELIRDKPLSANGRLYSSIDQFARARNMPTWFVLGQINRNEGDRYDYAKDWHFV